MLVAALEMLGQECAALVWIHYRGLPWIIFNLYPLFNNHSPILRQQFTYQCVLSEGDYQQKLDLLQIWWKEPLYKWLIKECIFSCPDMNADAKFWL